MFRHSAVYVRADGKVKKPEDLAGKRIGVPQWSQTACVYVRGWLTDTVGVPLKNVTWVQSGVNDPGRVETAKIRLPDGVKLTFVTYRSLTKMLLDGELDAVFSAHAPQAFEEGNPNIVRLIPNHREEEEKYFKETGVFPIMHTIAIRRDVYEKNRWIARNLFDAFQEAKRRSVRRLMDVTASHFALPWHDVTTKAIGQSVFGGKEYWPYGIEGSRPTLDAFYRWCYEQGVTARHLKPEEVYAPETLAGFKI